MADAAARWYEKAAAGNMRCRLCPRACLIMPGTRGFCGVRENRDGELVALTWARTAAVAVDPIEKKPLYHFYPGERTLSLGTLGCNLRCLHCQNSSLSTFNPDDLARLSVFAPEAVVPLVRNSGSRILSWTYNEPLVWSEYVLASGTAAKEAGLATVIVTAGFISPGPLQEILPVIDAFRLDIKGFTAGFYSRLTGFDCLATVLDSALAAKKAGCHLEIVTNIIDGWNDDDASVAELARWIAGELGEETPWHVTASRPAFKLPDIRPTPTATIARVIAIGRAAGLRHVYPGNIPCGSEADTLCAHCGETLITRAGFSVTANRLTASGTCPRCGTRLYGRF